MSFLEWAQLVGATTGALLGLGALGVKIVFKPIRNSMLRALDERLEPFEAALLELRPNGGSSVRDRIVRLEERQSGISNRLDDVYELVQKLATKE